MGVVYEAYDRQQCERVALKLLRNVDQHSLYRFKNEFRALADLSHPNLVRLGDLVCEDGQWFLTMELLDGVTFTTYVRADRAPVLPMVPKHRDPTAEEISTVTLSLRTYQQPCFDDRRLRRCLRQLAMAIDALHDAGKVHRDVKPSNVIVTTEGRTVLLDFGLVRDVGAEPSDARVIGTPIYMAPEQAVAGDVGPPADWYSVGVMLFQALVGWPPYWGRTLDVLRAKEHTDPPAPSALCEWVPDDLDRLCVEMLRRDPDARPRGRDVLRRIGVGEPARRPPQVRKHATFIGRGAELKALHRAFDDSCAGSAVMMCVHGESGIGKSALARHFTETLVEDRPETAVFSARCLERESMPFKAFDGIVDALSRYLNALDPTDAARLVPREVAPLVRVFPVLQRVPAFMEARGLHEPQTDPQQTRTLAFVALRELFSRLAERNPVVLAVDDFQWADADSLALLDELLRPPAALLVLATLRSASVPIEGDVRRLDLVALSRDESYELARALLGGPEISVASRIADEAGGHPLFIQELVHHVAAHSIGQDVPRFEDVLVARFAELAPEARSLLDVLAVAASPVPLRVAADAAGIDMANAAALVRSMITARVCRAAGAREADRIETYHDRIRETVIARLSGAGRLAIHDRLANAFERSGADGDPRALVHHLEAAGHEARASYFAERAARRAAETLAFDQAADLYSIALRLGEPEGERARALRVELAEALVNAYRGGEAADVYLCLVDGAAPALRLEYRRRAAEQLLTSGRIEPGLGVLTDVLREIGARLPPTPRRALVSMLWHRARLRLSGLAWRERDESEIPARDLLAVEVYKTVSLGLGFVDNVRGADFQARNLLHALRCGEPRRITRAIAQEAMYLAAQGTPKLDRARELAEQSASLAQRSGDPFLRGWSAAARGVVEYFAGTHASALEILREAEAIFASRTVGAAWELNSVRAFVLFCLRRMGTFRPLRRLRDEFLADGRRRGDHFGETLHARASNIVWLADDAPEAALAELEQRRWTPPAGTFHVQHWHELRARVEVLLYRRDPVDSLAIDGFAAARRALLLRIQAIRTETDWIFGRLALRRARDASEHERMRWLRVASKHARRLERERRPYATAWSRLISAAVAHQRGQRDRVLSELEHVIASEPEHDMQLCVAAARLRKGELLGNAEMIASAHEWMEQQRVRRPRWLIEVVAPGF